MTDPASLIALAEGALADGTEDRVIPLLGDAAARHPANPALLSALALLQRGMDQRELALPLLQRAVSLAPNDGAIARQFAQVSLEAGVPAAAAFERAIRLLPRQPDLRLGLVSARLHEGQGARALDELAAMLAGNPGWYDGHSQFAQLAVFCGQAERMLTTIDAALARFPEGGELHLRAINLLLDGSRHAEALERCDRALTRFGQVPQLLLPKAAALDALGRTGEAAELFAALGEPADPAHAVWLIRHLLRTGQVAKACHELDRWLDQPGAEAFWPYASLAWRLAGDPRIDWLEAQGSLVKVTDIAIDEAELGALRSALEALHDRSGRFLDQSVRGGTQTNGPLFALIDPAIARLRERLRDAVGQFASTVAEDPLHPTAGTLPRGRPRFAGSWSVRLHKAGHHAAHHHPEGCISASFYVTVPADLSGDEGHLVLGESPADLGLGLEGRQSIAPRPGRLVLFPSWMWHGTRKFADGQRMTVAFDVARR